MAITGARPEAGPQSAAASWTEATRLLCMAAYTDATFAQDVLEELVEEEHRAIHVPPGVDVAPVVRHCCAAHDRKMLRDRLLALDVVLSIVLTAIMGGLWLVIGFAVAWVVVACDFCTARYGIAGKGLGRNAFDPAAAPEPDAAALARVEELAGRQGGNVTVYSGFLPFAGAGIDLGGWSFVVDLRKGREAAERRLTPKPVRPSDLYEGVEHALRDLRMENLTIEDRAYVNGTDVRGDPVLLPAITGPPTTSIGEAQMQSLVHGSTRRIRHYMCARVTDWGGELVLSLFVRFGVANGRLFCERSGFLLPSLKPELQRGDGVAPELELLDVLRLAWRSLLATPVLSLRSLWVVLRPLGRHRRRARLLKRIKRDAFFDYGAGENVLDRVRSTDYARYFQKLDTEKYTKVLERAILDAIVEVLDAHDVETGELVERRTTIINNGVMVRGESLKVDNLAVGQGARILNRIAGRGRPAGPGADGGKA
ncbi:MAG: hypothetical protein ACRDLN_10480 [Solirubrobacteraceae bacterium]